MRRLLSSICGAILASALPVLAHADTFNIQTGIPGPVDINNYGILGYVQNAYVLALVFSGALALGSIVYGAVQYTVSRGNPSKLADAWDRILQALIGILLLVGAGTILSIVNPGLLSLELPRVLPGKATPFEAETYNFKLESEIPQIYKDSSNPAFTVNGGRCSPITTPQSPCTVDKLAQAGRQYGCNWNPTVMSVACRQESGGGTVLESTTDRCANNGRVTTFSAGVYQINILNEAANPRSAFPECRGVLVPYQRGASGLDRELGTCVGKRIPLGKTSYCNLRSCGFPNDGDGYAKNLAQFNACLNALKDPARNIKAACELYKKGGLGHWKGTASACKLSQ